MFKLTTKGNCPHAVLYLARDIYSDESSSARAVSSSLCCCMHMEGILMTCLPLVTERLHICLSRDMYVCSMSFLTDGTAAVWFINICERIRSFLPLFLYSHVHDQKMMNALAGCLFFFCPMAAEML